MASKKEEAYIVEIPGMGEGKGVEFSESSLTYREQKIPTKEIMGYSFYSVLTWWYIMPAYWSASITIESDDSRILISFTAPLLLGKSKKEQAYMEVVRVCDALYSPQIVDSLERRVDKDGELVFDNVTISKAGITLKKAMGRSNTLPWSGYHSAEFNSGSLNIYKIDTDGDPRMYASLIMRTLNVPVLKVLLARLANKFA